ncbi:2',3'-cyclic-nucleotide 2'-phosphodiesterase (5'-nucleotidase family) [Microbacterium halimionae]|uniref:2',3'-cyclic-nucleotide 2'-phosphodiesterase (5'-nucleotidase family) n=1 Tax=Microbacterium halimionae TaxID=1526413 RepID=A0A7W3JM82_9MICO|nr:5'-nucleotidase C-terminal domain-containing protein [Microbacterium halimionae]MBA8815410.1 2',3'-cyclic-nucleotide 2'-phosphodiesterase (5'-nucleotidase family) [Microbacterium halimionae]NII95457.1 2',3'-cyclic-nucleotide 2'-phosphodiesterase (5'-nucleotidase family) [Microbacterium halimionae]
MIPDRVLPVQRRRRQKSMATLAASIVLLLCGGVVSAPAFADDATAGASTSGDPIFPNVGNSGYDVLHYDIDMAYRTNSDISATTTIGAKASTSLSSFVLDFEGMTVDEVTVNGQEAQWSRDIDAEATKYKLIITPAAAVSGDFTVSISYSGAPARHIDADGSSEGWVKTSDGVTALGQPIGAMTWFPNNNTPADKATYDIDVTAPTTVNGNALSVASNGELVGQLIDADAGTTTWQWQQTKQMASELSILSIGRFNILESDIQLASGRTLHEWSFVDPTISVSRQNTINTRRAEIKSIIDWLETKLGAYPGESIGLIVDSVSVGYALETQDRPFFDGSVSASTLIHELVHQWLGNDVAPSDWSHIWLNEGAAEFFTTYYQYSTGLTSITPEDNSYSSWNSATDSRWEVPTVGFTDSAELYDWQVYNRGKYTLGALMTAIGREDFDELYSQWTARYGGASASTSDFAALAEEVSGKDLEAFFQDWIYDTDKPAWPAKWTAAVTSDVAGKELLPGEASSFTLSVENTGKVALDGGTVEVDAQQLLSLVTLSDTLPAGVSVADGAIVWSVPSLAPAATASVEIAFTVPADSVGGAIDMSIAAPQLGSSLSAGTLSFSVAEPVALNLLNINDFHGRIDANTVKFAGTIEQLRAEYGDENTLFLSAGDNIGASLFASSSADDQPTLDVLNALGLAASAVGNHEFDKGVGDLTGRVSEEADFPYLAANVYDASGEPIVDEYALFEVDGLTVAVIGAITEETPTLVSPGGISGLTFGDPVEAVNRVAAELEGTADVIIAEYHEGSTDGVAEDAAIEEEIAAGGAFADIVTKTSASVDAIFTGHTHKEYSWDGPIPGAEGTRPVVQTGSYGENIGQVVLEVDPVTGDVEGYEAKNVARVAIADDGNEDNDAEQSAALDAELVSTYPRVAEVSSIVSDAIADAAVIGEQVKGSVVADITTAFTGGSYVDGVWTGVKRDDRASQSTLGNLVADSLVSSLSSADRGGAEIGMVNPGGLRSDLLYGEDGTITYAEANAVLPFVNNLWTTTLTGAQFTAALEQQWQPEGASRSYLALGLSDNVRYTYDKSAPRGEHITGVWIDGEPIDPAGEYRVGSFSFLLQGGDNFTVLAEGSDTKDSGLIDRDAWISYLEANPGLEPDFASRSAEVTGVPETVEVGDTVSLQVSGINLTSLGSPENTVVEASIDDTVFAPFTVTGGVATVEFTVPDSAVGESVLSLVATDSGTQVTVPLTVTEATVPTEPTNPTDPGTELPSTGGNETPVAESELTPGNAGDVKVIAGDLVPGGTVTVYVGIEYAGDWVSAWLRSAPIFLGWYQVDAVGNITVTLPAGVTGDHRIVIQDADGNLIGWQEVTIGALAVTGGNASGIGGLVLIATLLLTIGAAARTMGRRREV